MYDTYLVVINDNLFEFLFELHNPVIMELSYLGNTCAATDIQCVVAAYLSFDTQQIYDLEDNDDLVKLVDPSPVSDKAWAEIVTNVAYSASDIVASFSCGTAELIPGDWRIIIAGSDESDIRRMPYIAASYLDDMRFYPIIVDNVFANPLLRSIETSRVEYIGELILFDISLDSPVELSSTAIYVLRILNAPAELTLGALPRISSIILVNTETGSDSNKYVERSIVENIVTTRHAYPQLTHITIVGYKVRTNTRVLTYPRLGYIYISCRNAANNYINSCDFGFPRGMIRDDLYADRSIALYNKFVRLRRIHPKSNRTYGLLLC